MSIWNNLRIISAAMLTMSTVETLLTAAPRVRARLARSSTSRVLPAATSCSKRCTTSDVARTEA